MRTRLFLCLSLSPSLLMCLYSIFSALLCGNALSVERQMHMAGFGFAEEIHSVCAAGQEGQFVKLCVLPLVSL